MHLNETNLLLTPKQHLKILVTLFFEIDYKYPVHHLNLLIHMSLCLEAIAPFNVPSEIIGAANVKR